MKTILIGIVVAVGCFVGGREFGWKAGYDRGYLEHTTMREEYLRCREAESQQKAESFQSGGHMHEMPPPMVVELY